jgi:UDP-N-acetylglucosamine--N-acetylmuramyl-(pentapeptide) pyrophosphoryl-undecaprenol N-acetylglucosamine transferase
MSASLSKIIFAGGGTGGHVYPALATIEALKKTGNFDILYIGGYRGIEKEILPGQSIAFKIIWISGFQRYFTLQNFLFFLKLFISLIQSAIILLKYKPDVVVGTGGYVSGPVLYMAAKLGYPTLIQEQDSYPGITTRLLARYVDVICVPYAGVDQYLKRSKGRVVITGNPVRSSLNLVDKAQAVQTWQFDPDRPVVFVFGGSQGAEAINQVIVQIADEFIKDYQIQILWQTGKKNFEAYRQSEIGQNKNILIKAYIEKMDLAYSAADIIISRAGAITLAELALAGKPCILVPYPHAAANHQEKNAVAIEQAGAAMVVREGDHFKDDMVIALKTLLDKPQFHAQMAESWQKIRQPEAAQNVVKEILQLVEGNDGHQAR